METLPPKKKGGKTPPRSRGKTGLEKKKRGNEPAWDFARQRGEGGKKRGVGLIDIF